MTRDNYTGALFLDVVVSPHYSHVTEILIGSEETMIRDGICGAKRASDQRA